MLLLPIHEQILREIALCRFMRAEQVTERFFSRGSKTYAQALLRELTPTEDQRKKGVTSYLKVIDTKQVGNRYLHGLDRLGVQFLRETGMDIKYYASEHKTISADALPHLLTTTNLVVAAAKLPASNPVITVEERRHYVSTKQRRGKGIPIPDAWFHIVYDRSHYGMFCEVDRGTEEEPIIRAKVTAIIEFAQSGAYGEEFGIPALTVSFLTTKGESRLQKLVTWVEKELTQTGMAETYGPFFHFAAIDEGPIDPKRLFYEPIHQWPFSKGNVTSLL